MTRRATFTQADLVRAADAAMVARYTGQARQKARAKSAQEKRE